MIDKELIERWLSEGIITQQQAQKMLTDVTQAKQEQTSNKLIVSISVIGSLLLGIGSILFVAANWAMLGNEFKVALLLGSTIGAYGLGYLFKYRWQNLPMVGSSLLFLGALLYGASIFLIAQIYHVNANSSSLLLMWLIGVLPFVYAFVSVSLAVLAVLIFYLWLGFYIDFYLLYRMLPLLYLVVSILLYTIGTLHYFMARFRSIGYVYRLFGINVSMLALFFLSFQLFSGFAEYAVHAGQSLSAIASSQIMVVFLGSAVVSIIALLISLRYNPVRSRANNLEIGVTLALIASALLFYFAPVTNNIYTIMFNFILAALILFFIIIGYIKDDMRVVNTGMFWLFCFIVARYFDFFWDLMPRSLFFIIGGLILVVGGILFERKRRELKTSLGQHHTFEELTPYKKRMFLLFGIFALTLLGGFIIVKEHILRTGREILLKTVPVDPRDLFRGDYVILRYDISSIDTKNIPLEHTYGQPLQPGDKVYVLLGSKDGYAVVEGVDRYPLQDKLYLQGTVKNTFGNILTIDYGIESYFVPENKGKQIEREVGKSVVAKVAVDTSGRAVIKSLLIDGKEVSFK